MMQRIVLLIGICMSVVSYVHAGNLYFPSLLTGPFSTMTSEYSVIHFNVHNNFNGIFFRRPDKVLTNPVSIQLGSSIISGCTRQVQGLYYNNQRGFRLWPLDSQSLIDLQSIDPSYSAVYLTGALFTNCTIGSGVHPKGVYGALGHIRGSHIYWIIAGVDFNFIAKTRLPTFSGSFLKNGSFATGRLFDSQGAIGQFVGRTGTIPPETCSNGANNPPACDQCPVGYVRVGGVCQPSSGRRPILQIDYCPNGDKSASYYDGVCEGSDMHGSAPLVGRLCKYDDEPYLKKGPFPDTTKHRAYPYIEIMRISCLHRGRWTKKGLRRYEPAGFLTKAEAIKTLVKVLGIVRNDFFIYKEEKLYTGKIIFTDVPAHHWFAHYAEYAYKHGLLDGMYTITATGTYFYPDAFISRQEVIKRLMLTYTEIYNLKNIHLYSGQKLYFQDVSIKHPYAPYIYSAATLGFISGTMIRTGVFAFYPTQNISRAEFAKIISLPFSQYLIDWSKYVKHSKLYGIISEAMQKTKSTNKKLFLHILLKQFDTIDDDKFVQAFAIDKWIFKKIIWQEFFPKPSNK